mgnify:CR=1 FL=1
MEFGGGENENIFEKIMKNHIVGTNVIIKKNTVVKTTTPELARIELKKMIMGRSISERCDLFRVPEVYDYDEKNGIIVLERIHGLRGIGRSNDSKNLYNNMIIKAGLSLATIHNHMSLPDDMKIIIDKDIDFSGNKIFMHGDFSVENVCTIDNSPGALAIIDWQMTSMHEGKATYGTRYFDIAWFINNLFSKPIYKYIFRHNVDDTAKLFIDAYFGACSDANCNVNEFSEYLRVFFHNKLQERKNSHHWVRKVLLLYGHNSWGKFNNLIQLENTRVKNERE